jgi:hypothetical protein
VRNLSIKLYRIYACYTNVTLYDVIYSVRYYRRFSITAVGLGTYYPWIRRTTCIHRIRGSIILAVAKYFLHSVHISSQHPSPQNRYWPLLLELKGHAYDHPCLNSCQRSNAWNYSSTPLFNSVWHVHKCKWLKYPQFMLVYLKQVLKSEFWQTVNLSTDTTLFISTVMMMQFLMFPQNMKYVA